MAVLRGAFEVLSSCQKIRFPKMKARRDLISLPCLGRDLSAPLTMRSSLGRCIKPRQPAKLSGDVKGGDAGGLAAARS